MIFHVADPICGINDPIIQRRLLSEKALSFKSAMERLAQGMESAAKNVRELNVPARDLPSSTATVHIKTHLWDLSTHLSKLNIFLKLNNIVLYES